VAGEIVEMTNEKAETQRGGTAQRRSLCMGCGALLQPDQVCETCGPQVDLPEDEEVQLNVTVAVQICDRCQAMLSCGQYACPSCGAPVEFTHPREAPLNRAKVEALGDLLPEFERVAGVRREPSEPASALTDEQLISYVNRNKVFAQLQLGRFKAVMRRIDVTSQQSTRSRETREALEGLLSDARDIRIIYDELDVIRMPERLGAFHNSLLEVTKAALDIHVRGIRALLAVTIEEARESHQALQSALHHAGESAGRLSDELREADIAVDALFGRRLRAFAGGTGPYECQGQPDFAVVLAEALQGGACMADLGPVGARHFTGTISVDPTDLTPEYAVTLYLLAAAAAVSDDPLTLRRRTREVFEILEEAFVRDRTAMTAAIADEQLDVEDAIVNLLSIGDLVRAVRPDSLPKEAKRLQLSQAYNTLVEWAFRRLINLLLAAKFILSGRPRPYADIQAMQFGEKHHILAQEADPRYRAALQGVAKVARNAGAHGEVDLSGALIRLRSVDRKGRIEEEELSDEVFADRLADLLLTCLALRFSSDLLRIEHCVELPEPSMPTRGRLAIEVGRTVLGFWGLSQAAVQEETDDTLVVGAKRHPSSPVREGWDYLAAAATLAVLCRHRRYVRLRVMAGEAQECQITVPTDEAVACLALPGEAKPLGILKLRYLSTLEPSNTSLLDRYHREWIRDGARLTGQQVARLQEIRMQLPAAAGEYAAALEIIIRNSKLFRDFLRTVEPPFGGLTDCHRLHNALVSIERDVARHLKLVRAGNLARARQGPVLTEGSAQAITALMM